MLKEIILNIACTICITYDYPAYKNTSKVTIFVQIIKNGMLEFKREPTFSMVIAKGALNHCSNVAQDLNIDGNKKFIRAQSSGSLFYKRYQDTLKY